MKEIIDSEKTLRERNTIPSADVVARSLLSVLQPGSASVISNYEEMARAAATLKQQLESAKSALDDHTKRQMQQQKDLDKAASAMERLAFGGALTSITQPLTRSASLEAAMYKVDSLREAVKNRFMPFYKDFKAKESAVKNDHLTQLERRLWCLFYTDGASVQRKTEALEAKANAF